MPKAQVKYVEKHRNYQVKFDLSASELVSLYKSLSRMQAPSDAPNFTALCDSLASLAMQHDLTFITRQSKDPIY